MRTGAVIPFDQAVEYYTDLLKSEPIASNYNSRGIVWSEKGEHDIAISDFNEAIRLEPGETIYWTNRGNAWLDKKEYGKAIADYNESIRLDPKYDSPYNQRAWLWATCPNEKYRDGKRAVESATRACELTEWKDASEIDTLAAAYAENGDFAKAAENQERAIKLYGGDDKKGWVDRLELYKEKKPYRDKE